MRRSKLLFFLFIISLGVNAWLISFQIGCWLHHDGPPPGEHEHVPSERIDALVKLLPDDARPALRARLEARLPDVRAKLQEIRVERRAVNAQLGNPTPDASALAASYAHIRALHSDSQAIYQEEFIKSLLSLPETERQQVVNAMKKEHPTGE